MKMLSHWLASAGVSKPQAVFPTLASIPQRHYDAIVVGGGVFGCTTAYKLKQEGYRVALVEARQIGSGVSSYSTAKLSAQHGPVYTRLAAEHNDQTALRYYHMNMRGISIAQELIDDLKLDCDFDKRDHILWTALDENINSLMAEHDVCNRIGIPCTLLNHFEMAKELPASVGAKMGLAFSDQAIFNPYKYCRSLANVIAGNGCDVFEESRVTNVEQSTPLRVISDSHGSVLTADYVVLATHMPITDRSMHFAIMEASKSHCIAARIDNSGEKEGKQGGKLGRCVHNMSINMDMPMRSLRSSKEDDVLILAGESIKQGDVSDTEPLYESLIAWTNQHFNVSEILCKWSAMDYFSGDHIPYIGYLYRGTDRIFTATGFSKWGLAFGIAGSELVTDLIKGKVNPYAEMVDARRWDLAHQWREMMSENVHVAQHLVSDKIKGLFTSRNILTLEPDEGSLVKAGLRTVGAYRDKDGVYHVVNPVCTHLGCNLIFNQGDKIWDCPCHGSQFSVDGEVIHGPAVKPLDKITDLDW